MSYKSCRSFVSRGDVICGNYLPQEDMKVCGLCSHKDFYRCIPDMEVRPLPLSHSALQDFFTCHQLFYLKQIRGIQVRNAHVGMPLKLGALWDKVLQWYLGDKKTVDIQATIDDYEIPAAQVEMVRGLYRAYKELGIVTEAGGKLQEPFNINLAISKASPKLMVRGFYDRKYTDYFVENKLSSKPDNYLDPFFIQSQVATYFLADRTLVSCVMEIARTPALKVSKAEEEEPALFGKRIYEDVMKRPGHYFVGYHAATRTYGVKFFWSEFNLDEVAERYNHAFAEIDMAVKRGVFYKQDKSCKDVGPGRACDYLGICRHNNMSESVYAVKEKVLWKVEERGEQEGVPNGEQLNINI